jgi:hypothetical protein
MKSTELGNITVITEVKNLFTISSIKEGLQSCHRSKWYLTAFNMPKSFLVPAEFYKTV